MKHIIPVFFFFTISVLAQTDFWQRVEGPYGTLCTPFERLPNGDLQCLAPGYRYTKTWEAERWDRDTGAFSYPYSPPLKSIPTLIASWGTWFYTEGSGIYASNDSGKTRRQVFDKSFYWLYESPRTASLVGCLHNNEWVDELAYHIVRSTDSGATWTEIMPTGFIEFSLPRPWVDRALFSMARAYDDTAVLSYISEDDGETWVRHPELNFTNMPQTLTRVSPSTWLVIGEATHTRLYLNRGNGVGWEALSVIYPPDMGKIYAMQPHGGCILVLHETGYFVLDTLTWKRKTYRQIPSFLYATTVERLGDNLLLAHQNGLMVLDIATWEPKMVFDMLYLGQPYDTKRCGGNVLIAFARGYLVYDTLTWVLKSADQTSTLYMDGFLVSDNGEAYMNTSSGLFFSSDCGERWIARNEGILIPDDMKIHAAENDVLLLSVDEHGAFTSEDRGASWKDAWRSVSFTGACVPCGDSWYLEDARAGGFRKSTDRGANWEPKLSGLARPECLACSPNGILYWVFDYPLNRVEFSSDGMASSHIYDASPPGGWPASPFFVTKSGVIAVGVQGNDGNALDIRRVPETGWKTVVFPEAVVKGTEVIPVAMDNDGTFFVRVGARIREDRLDKDVLYVSSDEGKTWTRIFDTWDYDSSHVADVCFNRYGHPLLLTEKGNVYISYDRGSRWRSMVPGAKSSLRFPKAYFTCMDIDDTDVLWAGTRYDGVFRSNSALSVESLPAVPATVALALYPNPAANTNTVTATITFDNTDLDRVTLQLVNELGVVLHTQEVHRQGWQGTATVPIHNVRGGYYIVRVIGQGRAMQQGLVVWRR